MWEQRSSPGGSSRSAAAGDGSAPLGGSLQQRAGRGNVSGQCGSSGRPAPPLGTGRRRSNAFLRSTNCGAAAARFRCTRPGDDTSMHVVMPIGGRLPMLTFAFTVSRIAVTGIANNGPETMSRGGRGTRGNFAPICK